MTRFLRERLRPAVYRRTEALAVSSWDVPGEPVDFGTAYAQSFSAVAPGQAWGRPWGTTWFRVRGGAPGGWGQAVANDATYGHDITRTSRSGRSRRRCGCPCCGRRCSPTRRLTRVSICCGARWWSGRGVPEAVEAGYRLNLPLREVRGGGPVEPLLVVDHPAIVVEAVLLAQDRSGDVVVRLYEAHGGRARGVMTVSFPVPEVTETDLLERPLADATALRGWDPVARTATLELRPFQIVTLRLARAGAAAG